MMRIGVVGSRRRTDEAAIKATIRLHIARYTRVDPKMARYEACSTLPLPSVSISRGVPTIVSGGCRGVDAWAAEVAEEWGDRAIIIRPDHPPGCDRRTMLAAMAVRNRKIAEACDLLIAFPAPDRKGGTEQTIKHAQRLGKPVILHSLTLL